MDCLNIVEPTEVIRNWIDVQRDHLCFASVEFTL
jgi:hypothetical protein